MQVLSAPGDSSPEARKPGPESFSRRSSPGEDVRPGHPHFYTVGRISEIRKASEADARYASVSLRTSLRGGRDGAQDAEAGLIYEAKSPGSWGSPPQIQTQTQTQTQTPPRRNSFVADVRNTHAHARRFKSPGVCRGLLRACCSGLRSDGEVLRRRLTSDFVRDMRMLSKLRHPNIVTVVGAVVQQDKGGLGPVLLMELMEVYIHYICICMYGCVCVCM